ncbi:MAG: hypothetical protein RLZZ273_755 [Bacteroidota bacterium]
MNIRSIQATSILCICMLLSIVGCSSPSEPAPKPRFFFVDTATGTTTIDTAAFRAVLLSYEALSAADVPEVSDMQEYAEAQEEVMAEIAFLRRNCDIPPIVRFLERNDSALASQENAMQVALNVFQLKDALPENSEGTFADAETDAAWDAAVGTDNKVEDATEAVHAMFRMACFAIKELREVRGSATSTVARFVADVELAATENNLMSLMQYCASNDISFPPSVDLPANEIEEFRERSAKKRYSDIITY